MKITVVNKKGNALTYIQDKNEKGDVHFGKEGNSMVIAKNTYKEEGGLVGECSNPAIIFTKENDASVQYVDDKGKIRFKSIDIEIVYKALSKLLKDVMKPIVKPVKK